MHDFIANKGGYSKLYLTLFFFFVLFFSEPKQRNNPCALFQKLEKSLYVPIHLER